MVLTDQGRSTLDGAAPEHARMVKRLLFAHVADTETAAVARFLTRILERLEAEVDPH